MSRKDGDATIPLLAAAAPAGGEEVMSASGSRRASDSSTDSHSTATSVGSAGSGGSGGSAASNPSFLSWLCLRPAPNIYDICSNGDDRGLADALRKPTVKALVSEPNSGGFPPLYFIIIYAEKVKSSAALSEAEKVVGFEKAVEMATLLLKNGADLDYRSFAISSLTDEAAKRGLTALTELFASSRTSSPIAYT